MLGGIGMTEVSIIFVIVLVIFGAGKLPEVGSALGDGIRNFKSSMADDKADNSAKGGLEEEVTPEIQAGR